MCVGGSFCYECCFFYILFVSFKVINMGGDNFTNGVTKKRVAMGDLTNQPLKRGYSSVSDNLGTKSGDRFGKDSNFSNGDSQFPEQLRLGAGNLVKEKQIGKFVPDGRNKEGVRSPVKDTEVRDSLTSQPQGNILSIASEKSSGSKEMNNFLGGAVKTIDITQTLEEAGEASRGSCASTGLMHMVSVPSRKDCDSEGKSMSNIAVGQGSINHDCLSDDMDPGVGISDNSKFGSVEGPQLLKAPDFLSFELGRCTKLRCDGSTNVHAEADLLKDCSCFFCLTAAYMWSDLHYQDIKGRLATLRKSQKEASILVNKDARWRHTDTHIPGNIKEKKLESDLMDRWKSLFRHMEDILMQETRELHSSFVLLKELRENCKTNLAKATGRTPDKD